MIPFDPFGKPLDELKATDLAVLRSVQEGWYVEYKREVPNAEKIAKSLSAFANHYGGWLFYGVAETNDRLNFAGEFIGIAKSEVGQLLERIRNAAINNVNPQPLFERRVIHGPCARIGLAKDRSVIAVLVAQGSDAPYVHSSGRIYRRIADASDPKPETDRAVLDLIWQRGQRSRSALADFLDHEPAMCSGSDVPYLILFMLPHSSRDGRPLTRVRFNEFTSVMRHDEERYGSFACNHLFSTPDGYIARQCGPGSTSDSHVLGWRYYGDGTSMAAVPIRNFFASNTDALAMLSGYEFGAEFLDACREAGMKNCLVIDLNILLPSIAGFLRKHLHLSKAGGVSDTVYCKARVVNINGCVPFVDTNLYLKYISSYGIPLIQDREIFVRPEKTPESLIILPPTGQHVDPDCPEIPHTDPDCPEIALSSLVFLNIMIGLGLEGYLRMEADAKNAEFVSAGQRGAVVHSRLSASLW